MSRPRAAAPAGSRAVLALLVLCLALPAAARVVHLYEVRHRLAEELLPLVETALGSGGRATADPRTNALLLTGEAAAVEDALALLAALDVRPRTVLVRYATEDAASLAERGVRIDWRVDAGGVRVGNVRGAGTRVGVRLDGSDVRRQGGLSGELRILEGESGRIATGVRAPLTTREVVPRRRGPVIRETTRLVSAESGFEARPRVLGDGRIELALRPFDERLGDDGRIERAGAETRVVLTPGETLVLGGIGRVQRRARSEALRGVGDAAETRERLLLVTATVDAGDPAPPASRPRDLRQPASGDSRSRNVR